jgi:ankyrin repeat protein
MPSKSTKTPATKTTSSIGQLGLDFDAAPSAEPAATPEPTPSIKAKEPTAPDWLAPEQRSVSERGMDALAMACSIQNAPLARALMELPERWDFNAQYAPGLGFQPGAPSPLSHLLATRQSHGWSNNEHNPGLDDITSTALRMVERGADFLQTDRRGLNAISLCAMSRRQEFFMHLEGHPRFAYSLMGQMRVGSLSEDQIDSEKRLGTGEDKPALMPDTRRPLMGHLILTGQLWAAEALVAHAQFGPNQLDPDGRLPIGYCRSLEAIEKLLSLGAQPGLTDAEGLNALARIQDVSETEVRDKMITRVANELKKSAKSDPSIMATLQAQNIAALLEAAQNAPKSSLLKTISAFKFDVSKARDPRTLLTPFMAACLGGRMASAAHLLAAGSDINAQDADGVSAASYLLAGNETSNGPDCIDVAKKHAPEINFSSLSHRGWPVALEAAFMMGNSAVSLGWNSKPTQVLSQAMAASGKKLHVSDICAQDGTSLLEAYALGCENGAQNYRRAEMFNGLLALSEQMKAPDIHDRAVVAMLVINGDKPEALFGQYNHFSKVAQDLQDKICAGGAPCHHSARFLQTRKDLAAELSKQMPTLYSHIESAELHAISAPGAEARKAARL